MTTAILNDPYSAHQDSTITFSQSLPHSIWTISSYPPLLHMLTLLFWLERVLCESISK